jgi:hypothetical protein
MGRLISNLEERVILDDGKSSITSNTTTIEDVGQFTRRLDTISTKFSGSGIEILRFVDSEEESVAGSFVKGDVRYIRISNLTACSVDLYFIKSNEESTIFNLDGEKTFMLGNGQFNASSTADYVDEGYVDPTYYSNLVGIDTIKAKAYPSSSLLEIVVASK